MSGRNMHACDNHSTKSTATMFTMTVEYRFTSIGGESGMWAS